MPFCEKCGVNATWQAIVPDRPPMTCDLLMGHDGPHQMTVQGQVIQWEEEECPHLESCTGCKGHPCISVLNTAVAADTTITAA